MSAPTSASGIRIGDGDRDEVRRLLNEHLASGRLTAEEFGERVTLAEQARTREAAWALFRDLPEPHPVLEIQQPTREPDRTSLLAPAPSAPDRWSSSAWWGPVHKNYAIAAFVAPCAVVGLGTGLVAVFAYPSSLLLAIVTVGVLYTILMLAGGHGQRQPGSSQGSSTGA